MVKFSLKETTPPKLDTLYDFCYKRGDESFVAFVEFEEWKGFIFIISRHVATGCTFSVARIFYDHNEIRAINTDYNWANFTNKRISKVYDASVVLS